MEQDRELLERAARAAGIGAWEAAQWNPLEDDGDAFRLVVKLGIDVSFNWETAHCVYAGEEMETLERNGNCKGAATRRAIVRCAASLAPV